LKRDGSEEDGENDKKNKMFHKAIPRQKKIPSLRIEDWGFYPQAPFAVLSSKTFE
jgi:hypothetical protein